MSALNIMQDCGLTSVAQRVAQWALDIKVPGSIAFGSNLGNKDFSA